MVQNVDARIKKSSLALVLAGLKLINKNKEISLRDIATEAGVGRATLYRLFANKEELIQAIAIHCLNVYEEVTKPIETNATSALHAFELLFDLAMPLTEEFQFLVNLDYFANEIPEVKAIIEKQEAEMLELIKIAKEAGSLDKKLPDSWVSNFIEGLFYTGWIQQKEHHRPAAESAKFAFQCFKKAVKPGLFG